MEVAMLQFNPVLKRTIWGGRRLGSLLHRPIGSHDDYAESWEIVDHGDDQSVVTDEPSSSGNLAGWTLGRLFNERRTWLMGNAWVLKNPNPPSFPLLLKFLDCNRVLSVQVHPDDAYGAQMQPPDLGKTEAWVILHSEPESVIYAGLKSGVDRSLLANAIAGGRTEECLHAFHPEVGDCVFIPAGTVHALGGGLVVAEIQQSSNTTFRLFDWNRVDATGQSRPLHIEQSLAVTDFDRGPVDPVIPAIEDNGVEILVECDQFTLRRIRLADAGKITIGGDDRCHLIACISGEAMVGDRRFEIGDCGLLPAAACAIRMEGSKSKPSSILWMTPT